MPCTIPAPRTPSRPQRKISQLFTGPVRKISQIFMGTNHALFGNAPEPDAEGAEIGARSGWLIKKPVHGRGLFWSSNRKRYIVFEENTLSWHASGEPQVVM